MALNSHTSGGYWHSILTPRGGLLGRGLETRGLLGCYRYVYYILAPPHHTHNHRVIGQDLEKHEQQVRKNTVIYPSNKYNVHETF